MADQNKQSGSYYVPDFSEEQEQSPKKYKNWPRSTRIIWIITAALAIIMILVLYSLNESSNQSQTAGPTAPPVTMESVLPARGPYSDPNLLRDFLYGDREESESDARGEIISDDVQESGRVASQVTAVSATNASGAGDAERPAPGDKPKARIVRKPPSDALLKARELSATALASAPEVALSNAVSESSQDEDVSSTEPIGESDSLTSFIRQLSGGERSGSEESASAIAGFSAQRQERGEDINSTSMAHQDRNEDFVKNNASGSASGGEYLSSTRRPPASRYELKAGSIINGVMMGGINSDLPGTILGQISEHVYDTATGGHILIPQGSRMIGAYDSHVVYGQNRILVVWQRIIYPDGTSLNLEGMLGSDQSGYAGFKQKIDHHYSRLAGAAIFASVFVAAGKEATKNDNTNSNSNNNGSNSESTRSIFAETVMENVTNIATQLIDKNLNVAPTLRILPGYRFIIVTTKDVAFAEPYVVPPRGGNR
jgi:type IV secretory pathway VirB10-like protein